MIAEGDEAGRSVTDYELQVEVRGGDLAVSMPSAHFAAVYYKPAGQPQLCA